MNTQEIKVSVIVPVYNVAKYVRQCLESLVNQTLKEIEIIIVNDASPDPLDHEICKEYAAKYENIIYLKYEKNKGLGAARNTAIQKAKGAYLGFVDSDDFVEKEMFEIMYEKAIAGNYDIVQCNYAMFSEENGKRKMLKGGDFVKETQEIVKPKKDLQDLEKMDFSIGNKCIKKKILADYEIAFPEQRLHEDMYFTFCAFFVSKKILFLKDPLYHYLQRPDSTNHFFLKKRVLDNILNLKDKKSFLEKHNASQKNKRKFQKFCAYSLYFFYCFFKKHHETIYFMEQLKKQDFFKEDRILQMKFYFYVFLEKFGLYKIVRSIYRIFLKPFLR